jgi:hypothetical protein
VSRIDLPEPYAVRFARNNVRDSLMSHGEECVLLHMYHVNQVLDAGLDDVDRCPDCFDNIYKGPDRFDCPRCFGTTFDGGVMTANRGWGIFIDADDDEVFGKRGFWHPIASAVHLEWPPELWQRDFVVRVSQWSLDHRPLVLDAIYVFKSVKEQSVRTGNQIGQTSLDTVGQRTELQSISTEMPIWQYPIVGQQFNRWDGAPR